MTIRVSLAESTGDRSMISVTSCQMNAFKPQVRTYGEVSGEDEQVRSSDLASKLDNLRVPE
jgi:hypothetical protein